MREAFKAAKIAGIAGLLVYLTWSIIACLNLLANQPIEGKPLPEDFTSFPPYVAWIFGIPIGLVAFICVFLVALIVFKIQSPVNMKTEYPTQNTVSIWIGTFASELDFDDAIETMVVPMLQLPIDLASVCETEFKQNPVSVEALLEGFSGWHSFSPAAISKASSDGILTANSALICYYVSCSRFPKSPVPLHFLGSFTGTDNN